MRSLENSIQSKKSLSRKKIRCGSKNVVLGGGGGGETGGEEGEKKKGKEKRGREEKRIQKGTNELGTKTRTSGGATQRNEFYTQEEKNAKKEKDNYVSNRLQERRKKTVRLGKKKLQ